MGLRDVGGKVLHRLLRRRLTPKLEVAAGDNQFGGLQGRATDFASMYIRAVTTRLRRDGRTFAVLFVDLEAAFYSVCREAALPLPRNAEEWTSYLRARNWAADDVNAFARLLGSDCACTWGQVNQHLAAAIAVAHSGAWAAIESRAELVGLKRGTMPGDPLADSVYMLLAAKILQEIREELSEVGLGQLALQPPEQLSLLDVAQWPHLMPTDVAYADDIAFVVVGEAQDITERLKRTALIVKAAFQRYFHAVNFSVGKTEAIIAFHGRGSRKHKCELFDAVSKIRLDDTDCLAVVPAYKHLGGLVVDRCSMNLEVKNRASSQTGAFRAIRKNVLSCALHSAQTRLALVDSLLDARLLHNAGTWSKLPAACIRKLNGAFMRPLRCIGGVRIVDGSPNLSDAQVRQLLEVVPVAERLRLKRLSFVPRLLKKAPAFVLAAVEADGSWVGDLHDDCRWLFLLGCGRELGDPDTCMQAWLACAKESPRVWKKMLVDAKPLIVESMIAADGNSLAGCDNTAAPLGEGPAEAFCYLCDKQFSSRAAWAAHSFLAHKRTAVVDQWVHSTVCPACCVDFHIRRRIVRHLNCSPRCLEFVQEFVGVADDSVRERLAADERLVIAAAPCSEIARRLHWPAVRVPGPLPVVADGRHDNVDVDVAS